MIEHYHNREHGEKVYWTADVIHQVFPDVRFGGIAALKWAGFYRCRGHRWWPGPRTG